MGRGMVTPNYIKKEAKKQVVKPVKPKEVKQESEKKEDSK